MFTEQDLDELWKLEMIRQQEERQKKYDRADRQKKFDEEDRLRHKTDESLHYDNQDS